MKRAWFRDRLPKGAPARAGTTRPGHVLAPVVPGPGTTPTVVVTPAVLPARGDTEIVTSAGPPATDVIRSSGTRRGALMRLMMLRALVGMLLLSCSGATTQLSVTGSASPGADGTTWTAGVTLGITWAKNAIPAARALLDGSSLLTPAARAQVDTALTAAVGALGLAQSALADYLRFPTVANLCRVHAAVDDAVGLSLQAIALARNLGVTIDPAFAAVVGSIGAIDDMLYPGCGAASSPPAARVTALERVRAALSR